MTTMSSREFNQQTSLAKKAAQSGPVIITDRGKPAFVLLTFDDYELKISGGARSLRDSLKMDLYVDAKFDRDLEPSRPVDF